MDQSPVAELVVLVTDRLMEDATTRCSLSFKISLIRQPIIVGVRDLIRIIKSVKALTPMRNCVPRRYRPRHTEVKVQRYFIPPSL
jgi:hypothetical protein